MQTYSIILGDWGGDGHGKYEKITVSCNKTPQEIQSALTQLHDLVGLDYVCSEYEVYYVWKETIDALLALPSTDETKNGMLSCLTAFYYNDGTTPYAYGDWVDGALTLDLYHTIPDEVRHGTRLHTETPRFTFNEHEHYAEFLLWCVKLVLPDVEFEIHDDLPVLIKDYGYGLFR